MYYYRGSRSIFNRSRFGVTYMPSDIEVVKLIGFVAGVIFLLGGGVCLPLIWEKRTRSNHSQVFITVER